MPGLDRAIPCSALAQQRHKIIDNRVALVGEESVSGVTRGSGRGITQENPPMRIYIIGNDGITLCREASATVNDGEIAVASNEELHAAPVSGKRLLALWNALPGVEKRRRVGNRGALIDQLWSAIEALPEPEPQSDTKRPSKQDEVIAMLARKALIWSCRNSRSAPIDRTMRKPSLSSALNVPTPNALSSSGTILRRRWVTIVHARFFRPSR